MIPIEEINFEKEVDIQKGSFQEYISEIEKDYEERLGNDKTKSGTGYKPFKRYEHFWKTRLTPEGSFPNQSFLRELQEKYITVDQKNELKSGDYGKNNGISWEPLGPIGIPDNASGLNFRVGNGRANVVAIDPRDENTLYLGSATGGLWKSTNGGQSWEEKRYDNFLSLAISHIAIDPSNSNVLYMATGDINTIILNNSRVVGGGASTQVPSIGVLKSIDGGNTWTSTGYSPNPNTFSFVSHIVVHPDNGNRVILATDDGLYNSNNGGTTFSKVLDGTFRDIKLNPINKNILHCALSNVNGFTFRLVNVDLNSMQFSSSPYSVNGTVRVELAVSTDQGGRYVYALAAATSSAGYGMEGIYRSSDSGSSWEELPTNNRDYLVREADGIQRSSGQSWYNLSIDVNPNNYREVYVGGINIWKSENAGQSFSLDAFWTFDFVNQGIDDVHADIHYLKFSPSGNTIYAATDGGLSASSNGGITWDDVTGNINTMQFYDISVDRLGNDIWILGGTQDNGTSLFNNGRWRTIQGGDGMRSQSAVDDGFIYTSYPNGFFVRTSISSGQVVPIGGQQTGLQGNEPGSWVTPIVVDKNNPTDIYVGYRNLWKSENRGASWTNLTGNLNAGNIDDIAISPTDPNTVYFCIGGGSSRIFKSSDGGQNWVIIAQNQNGTVNGNVTDIFVHPEEPDTFFYTVGGFSANDKVYRVEGTGFDNISDGLPNFPANTSFFDVGTDQLFVGTDVGVYVKRGFSNFRPFKEGMPNSVVLDFEKAPNTQKIYAGTYGNGVWSSDLIDCSSSVAPTLEVTGETTICDGGTVRLEAKGSGQIQWNTGQTARVINVSEGGTYFVTKTESNGCVTFSESVEITVSESPEPELRYDELFFCEGDSVRLRAAGGFFDEYFWNGEKGANIFFAKEEGEYTLTVIDNGCSASTETIFIEKAFGPTTPTISYDSTNNLLTASNANLYQWFRNGQPIDGAESKTFEPLVSGDYSVEVYGSRGCGSMSDAITLTIGSVSGELVEGIIYPNPVNDFFNINLSSLELGNQTSIEIYDVSGKLVYSIDTEKKDLFIDHKLQTGSYTVMIMGLEKVYIAKLNVI
ncbi:MAG: hypothetical protein Kapaf2KO_18320 [Candidatus Kapaibacteriales bacterium]